MISAQLLLGHFNVQIPDHIGRSEYLVIVTESLTHHKGLLEEDSQQCGRHRMAYGISNVETNMLFIETSYVVDVTGNPLCRQKGGGPEESFRVR